MYKYKLYKLRLLQTCAFGTIFQVCTLVENICMYKSKFVTNMRFWNNILSHFTGGKYLGVLCSRSLLFQTSSR